MIFLKIVFVALICLLTAKTITSIKTKKINFKKFSIFYEEDPYHYLYYLLIYFFAILVSLLFLFDKYLNFNFFMPFFLILGILLNLIVATILLYTGKIPWHSKMFTKKEKPFYFYFSVIINYAAAIFATLCLIFAYILLNYLK